MSELYETKTTYREIWEDWKSEYSDFAHTWQFWWILTLMYGLMGVMKFTELEGAITLPLWAIVLLVAFHGYMTNRQWGVQRA